MAVPAKKLQTKDHKGRFQPATVQIEAASVMELVARLYGLGFKRHQVASAHAHLLVESGDPKLARQLLRRWEQKQEFRDLIWKYAVVKADLETPDVLAGVTRAAKRGRVDAAKMILGVTDRYSDKSDMPQVVELRLTQMDRPDRQAIRPRGEGEIEATSTTDGAI
jgi:hypothetical protein